MQNETRDATPPSEARRATGRHHGDLKNELERAALELISERGPRGFTLAEVTRRAGVSVSAPYKHFADRDALLAALAERGYRAQRKAFEAAMAGEQDPAAQLAAFAAAYVRFAVTDRALFEVTFRAGLDKADHPGLDDAGQDVLVILQDPARRLRPDDSSALELVYAVAASAHGFAMFLLEGVFPDGDDTLDRVEARARRSAASLAEAEAAADFLP